MKAFRAVITSCLMIFTLLITAFAEKPNFIIIIADDLNDAVGPLGGHPQVITPHLDKMAAEGVNFLNAQINAPVCGPSRASWLTGLYPHTTGYYGYAFVWDHWRTNRVLQNSITFIDYLKLNGYQAMGTGKIFHNEQEDEEVWDVFGYAESWGPWPWDGTPDVEYDVDTLSEFRNSVVHPRMPEGFTIDEQFGSVDDVPNVPADPEMGIPGYKGWRVYNKPYRYVSDDDRDPMPDELNAMWVEEQLQQKHDKPFIMCVGINRPHTPLFAPQEYMDMYPLDTLKLPEINPNDLDDVSEELKSPTKLSTNDYGYEKYDNIINAGGEAYLKEWLQAYLANISYIDVQIGRMLDALEGSEYAENTYVIFTSDHGHHMGEKNYVFKNSPWEESTRVPFIVKGPDIPEGEDCETPITLIDMFPTLISMADLPGNPNRWGSQKPLDGHDLTPLLKDPKAGKWDGPDIAVTSVAANDSLDKYEGGELEKQFFTARSKRYRYILCPNGDEELYDHETDPNEWTNLAYNEDYAEIKKDLRKQLFSITGHRE